MTAVSVSGGLDEEWFTRGLADPIQLLGMLIGPLYCVTIPGEMMAATDRLEVDVSNLMANRIADLDRRGVEYRKFYNVDFPARRAENRDPDGLFNAASGMSDDGQRSTFSPA